MKIITIGICMLTLLLFLFSSCEDKAEELYGRPDWLKGNAYVVLQDKGNYSLFLNAIDYSGYRDVVDGKGLCTIFAPTDEAFRAYLKENGYSGIADIKLADLKILVGQHIVQYSFKTSQLLNFQHLGVDAIETYPAGLNYKQQTFAQKPTGMVFDPVAKTNRTVYNKEKYLPILSTELFKTRKLANAEADYRYFYPKSNWHGSENRLYAANAGVLEEGIPTDNGYVYPVDGVIRPLRTVYDVLDNRPSDFSVFQSVYNRFADLKYDSKLSEKYAAPGDSLFVFYHNQLPKIASEWTYNDENPGSSFLFKHTSRSFNFFAPDNKAMQSFLSTFFEGNYASYNDVPLLTLFYLAQNHVKTGDIVFPDNIRQGESSIYGDTYDFDVDRDTVHRELCSNGVFYGVNRVITPAMFRSVSGPVFKSPSYSIFAYILHKATELTQLINLDSEYTLFIPTDEILQQDYRLRLNYGNGTFGAEKLEKEEDGKWITCPELLITEIAQQHIVFDKITDFSAPKIYKAKGDFTYVVTEQGGVRGESSALVAPAKTWDAANAGITNGVAYEIPALLAKSTNDVVQALQNSSEHTIFYAKLVESKIIDDKGMLTFLLAGDKMVILAPTDEALGRVKLPTDKAKLADYLSYFFVSTSVNSLGDYILPAFGVDGFFQTMAVDRENSTIYETVYHRMGFTDEQKRLKITNKAGTTTLVTEEEFPIFAKDGVIYPISQVIQP